MALTVVTASVARASDIHDYPFFPERMRPVMTWLEAEAKREDPFLQLRFRSFEVPATSKKTALRDALVGYRGPHGTFGRPPAGGPTDGAFYGFEVGSDKWHVVYDPVHRLAYYGESCCAYGRDVLMRVRAAAPPNVPRRDLSGVRTARGIRLGSTMAQVEAREGTGRRRLGPTRDRRTALAYWSSVNGKTCVEERTFVFMDDRLRAIQVIEGC